MSSPNQDDFTLDGFFEEVSQEQPENPYEKFCLLSNPFPRVGQFYGICVDQESVKGEFRRILREFYHDSQSQVMTIFGSTGAGKTNLLRFLEQTFRKWREPTAGKKAVTDLFTVFVEQPQGSYLEIHRQIINQLGALLSTEFFSELRQRKINPSKLPDELSGTHPALIQILVHIAQRDSGQLNLQDASGQTSFLHEPLSYRILENWLQGIKLSAAEKKHLGNVLAEVGKSSTVAIKFLSDLVKIFLHVELFKGIIIFIDEFEEVFSGLSPTYQAQYAQDLRNLFDSLSRGVMFVVATAPIAERLQQISPALQRRLGSGVDIAPIADETDALKYAKAYIQWGRDKFKRETDSNVSLPEDCLDTDLLYYPLSEAEVKKIYNGLKDRFSEILPGDLLPALNHLLYRRVYKEG